MKHDIPRWILLICLTAGAGCAIFDSADSSRGADDRIRDRAISEELAALFATDQADRSMEGGDWSEITARDGERRARVLEIVQAGQLSESADYYHAAMILQHGDRPEDYLLAHVLSTIAGFEGHREGRWLSAAALDRFLQAVDRPQIFGTQYFSREGGAWTQEPYDRSMHDSIRAMYGVPPRSKQADRLDRMNKARTR